MRDLDGRARAVYAWLNMLLPQIRQVFLAVREVALVAIFYITKALIRLMDSDHADEIRQVLTGKQGRSHSSISPERPACSSEEISQNTIDLLSPVEQDRNGKLHVFV